MSVPHPLLELVARRVRARRAALGLSARELATRAGLSPRFVSQLENGQGNIALSRLADLAGALGLDVADLVASPVWLAAVRAGAGVGGSGVEPPLRPRPVALVGLRGAGKSTIGALLADALRWPFVEVDGQIEAAAGLDLPAIFSVHGEEYYRRLEAVCVAELLGSERPMVLALSGGVVTNGPVFERVLERCTTVWLHARPEQHMERVLGQGDRRPVVDRRRPMEELRAMLAQREPAYRRAEIRLDTGSGGPGNAVDELLVALETREEERRRLPG